MRSIKMRKARAKSVLVTDASKHKQRRQKTVDTLLCGLDMLAAHAEGADLGMAARIFYTAREDLVHWAVNMNFHESAQDRFINRRLYNGRFSAVEDFIARDTVKDSEKTSLPKTKRLSQAMRK